MANSTDSAISKPTTILTVVLTTMLGMQLLRGMLPYLQPLLGERLGWGTISIGLFALAIFLCAFLAWPLNRFFGSGLVILITGFAIGLSRLAAQLWTGDPIGQMIFTISGAIAFLIFLPTTVGVAVGSTSKTGAHLAIGILAGMALDLALNGAFFTYDLIWQSGLWPTLIVVLLVLAQWWSVFTLLRQESQTEAADTGFARALSWSIIGPFLFLELLIFSNLAWAATSTGWSFAAAFFWLLLAHGFGLAIWAVPSTVSRILLALALILALGSGVLLFMEQTGAWITAIYLLSGQVALAGTLVAVLNYLGGTASHDGLRNISITGGISMVLLVALLFAYYAAYDLPLPFSNQILPLVALVLVVLFGFPALLNTWRDRAVIDQSIIRTATAVVLLTLLIPVVIGLTQDAPQYADRGNEPLRVMTYNLHYGSNTKGQLDLEALAQVIETEQPDVVGLQEVSRGWVINGSVDMLVWTAKRLDMALIFGPASDAQWGNAVLTRLPVLEQNHYPLPTENLLLRRGFIHARLSGSDGREFNFINTHYHNPADGGDVRVLQSQEILGFAEGLPLTIITGDLNADHGMAEIDMYVDSGYGDVLDLTGVEPGHTNPVPDPSRRIDYIFVTPDWQASSAVVPYSEASDHLPIAVSLGSDN